MKIKAYINFDSQYIYFDTIIPEEEFEGLDEDERNDIIENWLEQEVDQRLQWGWDTTSKYHGIGLKYIEDRICKFCGDVCLNGEPHLHRNTWVCVDCWDDRLKCTE